MSLLGIHLTMLIGTRVATPAPLPLMEALRDVEVEHGEEGRSGFRLTFQAGRSGPLALTDSPLLSLPQLRPFNRVILVVTFSAMPRVLMDGIITHQELSPSADPGRTTLTVTGEDVSVMMDLEEKSAEHPAQDESVIAYKIIGSYAEYGLIPMVLRPGLVSQPNPIDRTPVQQGTDLEYLKELAGRHGYVFYVAPGPAPFSNTAYWGPPQRMGVPQRALSVNLGPHSNVDRIGFRHNALDPTLVEGNVQDADSGQTTTVRTFSSTRPPLASQPSLQTNRPNVRRRQFRESGVSTTEAMARAQGRTDASADSVTATGELDALRYGDLLQARGLVGLRGVGYTYDGLYYVERVTHTLRQGEFKQQFTLKRDGVGSTIPAVMP